MLRAEVVLSWSLFGERGGIQNTAQLKVEPADTVAIATGIAIPAENIHEEQSSLPRSLPLKGIDAIAELICQTCDFAVRYLSGRRRGVGLAPCLFDDELRRSRIRCVSGTDRLE